MLTVRELARQAGVTPHAVRYYVRIGLLTPHRNPGNGYRLFNPRQLGRLRFIRRAQSLGYTLSEIGEIIRLSGTGQSPCPQVRDMIRRRIRDNASKLAELKALQERMETALSRWEDMADCTPSGDMVCHLIESFSDSDTP